MAVDVVVQERDKLTVAAEGATRLRIKNQEILAKEEQVRALLASNRTKLDNLLGTRGKGIHLEPLGYMFLLWSGNLFLLWSLHPFPVAAVDLLLRGGCIQHQQGLYDCFVLGPLWPSWLLCAVFCRVPLYAA